MIIIIINRQRADANNMSQEQWNTNIKTTVRRNVKQSKSNKLQSVLLTTMNW